MRITRSQEQWQTIIDDQQTSGLTIIDYCQQQQLSTSGFYAIKKKLGLTPGNFVRAKITQQVEILEAQGSITLTMGKANVCLPSTTTPLSKPIVTSISFMKMFVDPSEVYLHRDFVDFRKAINGLAALVEDELNRDAYTGALFVFCNKAKDKLKILYWDKTGFALWQKRLEKQKFKWPSNINDTEFSLTAEQLSWLLSGYDVLGHQELYYQSMI